MLKHRELSINGTRWRLLPGLAASGVDPCALFDDNGLRLDEWLATGHAQVVKRGTHRAVYRVVLPGLDFIVKVTPLDARAGLRSWLRNGPAEREGAKALAVAARGVPTVEPLAIGEHSSWWNPDASAGGASGSYLLLRTLPDVRPFGTFLENELLLLDPRRVVRLRQRLARALGQFLAAMHDAGVSHADLHPDNLLLTLASDDQPSFHLVDLQSVRLRSPLDWRQSRANLALFNRWFALRVGRADRLRFWHAYHGSRTTPNWTSGIGVASGAPAAAQRARAVRQIERATQQSNRNFWRTSDRRCLESNRYFRRVRVGTVAGHVVADLATELVQQFFADPDAPFLRADARVLKDSPSSTVVELDLATPHGIRRVIYKRFRITSWSDPWRAVVRQTPTLRSYVLGHGLRFRGLPTPRPLGAWQRFHRGLPHEGYLLTEKVPNPVDLISYADSLGELPPADGRARLREALARVARVICDLHQRGLSHRDLKAANLLISSAVWSLARSERERRHGSAPVVATEPSDSVCRQAWFIDLVGVRNHGRLRRRRRIQNLARLNASFAQHPALTRTDRLRFLRVYLRWGLRGRFGWKRWWQQIEAATDAKIRRNQKNGRPLG